MSNSHYPMDKLIKHSSLYLSLFFAIVTIAVFLFFPLSSVTPHLIAIYKGLPAYYEFFMAASLGAAVFFFLLHRVFLKPASPIPATNQTATSPKITWLHWVISVVILAQAILLLGTPLGIDEHVHGVKMAMGHVLMELNPLPNFATQNHIVAQLLAIFSIKTFGVSKIALRLPAILFTLGLLWVLLTLGRRALSSFSLSLLLLHLCANQMVMWYAHSMRGYISMILVSTAMFLIVLEAIRNPLRSPEYKILLFTILFLLSPFVHFFAALFCFLILLSLVVWLNLERDRLEPQKQQFFRKLIERSLLCLPVLAVMFIFKILMLMGGK